MIFDFKTPASRIVFPLSLTRPLN